MCTHVCCTYKAPCITSVTSSESEVWDSLNPVPLDGLNPFLFFEGHVKRAYLFFFDTVMI